MKAPPAVMDDDGARSPRRDAPKSRSRSQSPRRDGGLAGRPARERARSPSEKDGAAKVAQTAKDEPVASVDDSQLPSEWALVDDVSTGRKYYYNSTTGESRWERPAPAALPADWSEHKDASGRVYYHNSQTGRTQWQRPRTAAAGRTPSTAAAAATLSSDAHPPAPWMQLLDPNSGQIFFWNAETHESRWEHPASTPAVVASTSAPRAGVLASSPVSYTAASTPAPSMPATSPPPTHSSTSGGKPQRQRQQRPRRDVVDPMDPSAYSDTPRGGWGAGLKADVRSASGHIE